MKSTIATIVAGMVVFLGAWSLQTSEYSEALTIAADVENFDELSGRFVELAHEKGGVYAYEILRRAELPPNTDLHLLGHVIGNVLYEERGVHGIAACTQDFRNACSHSVVIGALNEFGESALDMIRDACHNAPGGSGAYTMCYHGLGHGVFAYYDYSIPDAVAFCRKTGTEEYHEREYVECVGGIIMELVGGGGHNRDAWLLAREKYLDPKEPLAPCSENIIPEDARGICFTYLTPRLWELAGVNLGTPDPSLLGRAFAFCDAIPSQNTWLRSNCYEGFGKEFFPIAAARDIRTDHYTDAQIDTVVLWCGLAGNTDGAHYCMHGAVSSAFWGGEKNPEVALLLCERAGALASACYERLAESIAMYLEEPVREDLCARLPADEQSPCIP